jgi:cytochrome c oxidase subunit IV
MSAGHNSPTYRSILTVLLYLSIITIVEVGIALLHYYEVIPIPGGLFKILMIVGSLGKAYFIVSEFMHMKYETNRFVFYTLVSMLLLIWFIVALLYEGNAHLLNRVTYYL